MESKVIKIEGINNRYQIKKCMKIPTEIKQRKSVQHVSSQYFQLDAQLSLLLELETNSDILCQLGAKLSSYKQQDIEKKIYNADHFVKLADVSYLLTQSQLACYYCSEQMYLLYSNVREKRQWTLDRINNDLGHNRDNVIIACLECNLKRRNINKNAFLFTKNIKITRLANESDPEPELG